MKMKELQESEVEKDQIKEEPRPLSPISRRALFRKMAKITLGVGVAVLGGGALLNVAACGDNYSDSYSESSYSESRYSESSYTDNCGYCNSCGRNYTHCDGMYCNYTDYADGC